VEVHVGVDVVGVRAVVVHVVDEAYDLVVHVVSYEVGFVGDGGVGCVY